MRYDFYKKAKKYLQIEYKARDIDNRSITVWNLTKLHILPNLETMDKALFVKYFSKFQSFDRAVRAVQEDCPELRDKLEIVRDTN